MARPAPKSTIAPDTVPAPEPAPAQRVQMICATCKGWSPLGSDPVLGECMPSRRARPQPIVTTDLTTCSRWVIRQ